MVSFEVLEASRSETWGGMWAQGIDALGGKAFFLALVTRMGVLGPAAEGCSSDFGQT